MNGKSAVKIGERDVGAGYPCYIVAEAGLNHNGELGIAKKMVDAASWAQVDAIKFQKRDNESLMTKEFRNSEYNKLYAYGPTYGDHRRALELSDGEWDELIKYARQPAFSLDFFASAWDMKSVDFLMQWQVLAFKIPSPCVVDLPLLEYVATQGKPIILSTGMSTLEEIDEAVNVCTKHTDDLILLHCCSAYPFEAEYANLRVMKTLRDRYGLPVGYSGHEKSGHVVSLAALALGACVLERHFTMDHTLVGPDHAASLEPHGFRSLVEAVRTLEASLGTDEKKVLEIEIPVREKLGKSIVAARKILAGQLIERGDLVVKSPGTGMKPKHIDKLVGKIAKVDVAEDTIVPEDILKE